MAIFHCNIQISPHITLIHCGFGESPILIVDGRELSLEEFGRLLNGYEGWQFELEIADRTDEA